MGKQAVRDTFQSRTNTTSPKNVHALAFLKLRVVFKL